MPYIYAPSLSEGEPPIRVEVSQKEFDRIVAIRGEEMENDDYAVRAAREMLDWIMQHSDDLRGEPNPERLVPGLAVIIRKHVDPVIEQTDEAANEWWREYTRG